MTAPPPGFTTGSPRRACGSREWGILRIPHSPATLPLLADFDLGMTGPPLSISMDFIATGLADMIFAVASAILLATYAWWASALLMGAWLGTHWLLRESGVWRDRNTDEVRGAQRDADYAYRLAVDPPASKELRLFGLAGWTIDRFIARRTRLHELQYAATRLRERPVIWSMLLVVSANVAVFWLLANAAAAGRISLAEVVVYVQSAIGVSMMAFGGFSWALDGAAAPVAAVLRLEPAMRPRRRSPLRRSRRPGNAGPRDSFPRCHFCLSRGRTRAGPTSTLRFPLVRRSQSWDRTAPGKRLWQSCCAACTILSRARSRSTAWMFASSISRPGGRA